MNKAFVREPESDGRAYCPRCGALGTPVNKVTLDRYVRNEREHNWETPPGSANSHGVTWPISISTSVS